MIELLVVIAIIGILAAVVLVSLNSARDKANDAAAVAQLSQLRSQAELYYTDNNAYNTGAEDYDGITADCSADDNETTNLLADETVRQLLDAIKASAGDNDVHCFIGDQVYSFSTELSGGEEDDTFCVDSSGKAKEGTVAGTAGCV